jgi:hypothetical protein
MTKERAKELAPLLAAYGEGKQVQFYSKFYEKWIDSNGDSIFTLNDDFKHRIKPESKYRPWKPEEVPVGALIKGVGDGSPRLILGYGKCIDHCGGVLPDNCVLFVLSGRICGDTLEFCLPNRQHSLDHGKTWQPCGVLE